MRLTLVIGALLGGLVMAAAGEAAGAPEAPWMDARLSPDRRADLVLRKMTLDEEIALLHGQFPLFLKPLPPGVVKSAGYVPGIPRLGVPALHESDASLGVANAGRDDDDATPLPSGLALASTWSAKLAFEGGAMIGKEARQKGFNVMLAGGVNLLRDPRNGRNFEYLGEDPLLAGALDGASIRGIQSQHVISTAKHFVINDQESGRESLSANIAEAALRESDLLAFEIAIETGDPGSVMCSYNRINGVYACENPLLTTALKQDWGWRGWVMSDWGAVHALTSATAGLDQESGQQLDKDVFFDKPLKQAVMTGEIPAGRMRDMAHRILRSMFADGVIDHPLRPGGLDTAADAAVSAEVAAQGIVLLKNQGGLLPLTTQGGQIAVIGSHADVGVLSGGGSSQVIPKGSIRFPPPKGAPAWGAGVVYHPSSPLKAVQARAGGAAVRYDDGTDPVAAAALAKGAEVAVVFAHQWASEGVDVPLTLPDGQDALIEAVAAANPHTIVVLETGGPVLMPWLGKVGAVLEAWYPGARGGDVIAGMLYGEINPSGRLAASFPASGDQPPRGGAADQPAPIAVDYDEGSDIGYRWYAKTGRKPLFPFGYGLSYTSFRYGALKVEGGRRLSVSFRVTNTGSRAGIDTPQVYLSREPTRRQQRLIGWSRVALAPGESRRVTIVADPRLLANWNDATHSWKLDGGAYDVFVGHDSAEAALSGTARLQAASLRP